MTAHLTALKAGVAALLAETWPTEFEWAPDPSPPLSGTRTAIVDGPLPATPDAVVAMSAYDLDTSPDSIAAIQFSIRGGTILEVDLIEQRLNTLLDGRWGGMLGDVKLSHAWRSSGTSNGQDSDGRRGRYETYNFMVYRPNPNRV